MSRTRLAPTPTNISTKSEPEMVKNGTPASPAMARASRVLPVPGEPTSSAPLGILPPSRANLPGSFRYSTISSSSSRASSMPGDVGEGHAAFLLGQHLGARSCRSPSRPPPAFFCIWRMTKKLMPRMMMNGSELIEHDHPEARLLLGLDLDRDALGDQAGRTRWRRPGAVVVKALPPCSLPVIAMLPPCDGGDRDRLDIAFVRRR